MRQTLESTANPTPCFVVEMLEARQKRNTRPKQEGGRFEHCDTLNRSLQRLRKIDHGTNLPIERKKGTVKKM